MAKAKPTKSVSSSKKPRMKKAASEPAPTIQGVPLVWIPSEPSQPPAVSSMCAKEREKNNTKEDNKGNQQEANNAQSTPQTSQPDSQNDMGDPAPFPTEAISKGRSQEEANAERPATPLSAPTDRQTDMGDVASVDAESAVEYSASVQGNLPLARVRDGETRKQCWERLRQEGRTAGMNRRQAISYAGVTVDRVWIAPLPPEPEQVAEEPIAVELPEAAPVEAVEDPEPEATPTPIPSDQGVSGLGTMPESWGILPANASLQVEISWVSANRLRVRDGTGVDLSKALSPAPSYSALSWLETSILFPSKFADISVKATANQDDEREAIRREKLSIEEIRGLLAEMLEG